MAYPYGGTMSDPSALGPQTMGSQQAPSNRIPQPHRVHSSCDRCRSRKTKCIDPVPGPCRYCARTGATCRIATPRRKRPYYHVTEEEYQCSMRILEYFFPDRELNLHSLRSIAKDVANWTLTRPGTRQPQASPSVDEPSNGDEEEPEIADEEPADANDLHEPLGYMMKDSHGRFRYIGAHSEIPFNAAVVSLADPAPKDASIINPPKVGAYPPALTPTASPDGSSPTDSYYLPPRQNCDYYISQFLENVHCTHWFYSIETFLAQVDMTYSGYATNLSESWFCSLYAIFALGSSGCSEDPSGALSTGRSLLPGDEKSSTDYVSLAKQLVPAVYDEADIDSIRALAILSIALENLCSRVSSYLYVGASIQMAYSLGLHRDQMPDSGSSMEREQYRRIWWTLFTLEKEVASRGGSPTLVDERLLKIDTPLPSEQILYPGMHTPLSWLSTSVSLCRLKREIIEAVYPERTTNLSNPRSISFSTISSLLLSLQKWFQQIPPHLKPDVPVPPTHRRAISLLHLQYWGSTILLTRPFLLYLVLKHSTLDASKKVWFERMGKTCIDAAQKSLGIMQQMAREGCLSSVTANDSTCILRIIMIFILAFGHTKMLLYRSNIEASLELLGHMRHVGFTKMVAKETPMRVADLGIIGTQHGNGSGGGRENEREGLFLDDDLIAQLWGNLDPNFMTPLQTQQSLDLAFDDASSFDLSSELLQCTNLDDSIIINPSQAYNHHQYNMQ